MNAEQFADLFNYYNRKVSNWYIQMPAIRRHEPLVCIQPEVSLSIVPFALYKRKPTKECFSTDYVVIICFIRFKFTKYGALEPGEWVDMEDEPTLKYVSVSGKPKDHAIIDVNTGMYVAEPLNDLDTIMHDEHFRMVKSINEAATFTDTVAYATCRALSAKWDNESLLVVHLTD